MDPDSERVWPQTARWLQSQQRRRSMAKPPADWVHRLMARYGIASGQSSQELTEAWTEVVGDAVATKTRVGAIRRGVLEVTVAHSAILQRLTFQQQDFLKQLQIQRPHFQIKALRFRVGPIA